MPIEMSPPGLSSNHHWKAKYMDAVATVGTPPQSAFEKILERYRGFVGIGLAFYGQNVGLLDHKFSRILDDYDSLATGNRLREDVQQCGFSRSRSAADENGLSIFDLPCQVVGQFARQCAAIDEVVGCVFAARKLADDHGWGWSDDRRNDCRQTAPIGELGVENRIVLIEFLAEFVRDHLKARP